MLIKASFSVYVSTNNYRVAAVARTRVGRLRSLALVYRHRM